MSNDGDLDASERAPRAEVSVSTLVALPPSTAFTIFTAEVDSWWKQGRRYRRLAPSTLRFSASALLEEGQGTTRIVARVTRWAPPRTLELEMDGDPVRIDFEPTDDGTRVTVRQRAAAGLTAFQSPAGLFWADLLSAMGATGAAAR